MADGTGSTILFGEQAHGIGTVNQLDRWHWWTSSIGTQFTSMWPPNPQRSIQDETFSSIPVGGTIYQVSASSFHGRGTNFAFVDGSVHYIKDSVDSWISDPETGVPPGVSYSIKSGLFKVGPDVKPGVYQALSTRAGGEVNAGEAF